MYTPHSNEHQLFQPPLEGSDFDDMHPTDFLGATPSPSEVALAEDKVQVTVHTVYPQDLLAERAVAYPRLSDTLKEARGPVTLVGMLAMQAKALQSSVTPEGRHTANDAEAAGAVRVEAMRREIAASLINPASSPGVPPVVTESTLGALGLPENGIDPHAYLTTRVVTSTLEGVRKTHISHSGAAKKGLFWLAGTVHRFASSIKRRFSSFRTA